MNPKSGSDAQIVQLRCLQRDTCAGSISRDNVRFRSKLCRRTCGTPAEVKCRSPIFPATDAASSSGKIRHFVRSGLWSRRESKGGGRPRETGASCPLRASSGSCSTGALGFRDSPTRCRASNPGQRAADLSAEGRFSLARLWAELRLPRGSRRREKPRGPKRSSAAEPVRIARFHCARLSQGLRPWHPHLGRQWYVPAQDFQGLSPDGNLVGNWV